MRYGSGDGELPPRAVGRSGRCSGKASMARLCFAAGTRYTLGEDVYRVHQVLPDARVVAENQASGVQVVVLTQDLVAAWGVGALVFEARGDAMRAPAGGRSVPLVPETVADLQGLDPAHRAEAWRRYTLIRPLLALPPAERTRAAIAAYATAARGEGDARASRTSLERWLRAYEESGQDIRALVPATSRSGAGGHARLDDEVEAIVGAVLAACAAAPRYRTGLDVYLLVLNRVSEANRARPPAAPLIPPSPRTIYRRIAQADAPTILRRVSRAERRARQPVGVGPRPARILERVEIDHAVLDVILVDADDRRPIGRPTLTLALDVYSGFPLGCYVGFEPPSYRAVQSCLLHAILPKADVRARYGTAHPWPVHGLPETLVVDNGPEFVGRDLDDACAQLGINLERTPVRQPWYKGSIERHFRTHNTGLVHTLPGATGLGSGSGGEGAAGRACLTLDAFWRLLHVFLLDVYAERVHTGVGGIPARRWAQGLAAGVSLCLPASAEEARILLGRVATRTVRRTGIALESLRYQAAELGSLPLGATVRIKYDPADLGAIHAFDARSPGRWLRVPAVDQGYARGLSLWAHRAIRARVLRERGGVNMHALAAAKAQMGEIVAQEYARTRRGRRRKVAARFLGRERAEGDRVPMDPPEVSGEGESGGAATATLGEVAAGWDIAAVLAEPGWGVDYDIPRDDGRGTWR